LLRFNNFVTSECFTHFSQYSIIYSFIKIYKSHERKADISKLTTLRESNGIATLLKCKNEYLFFSLEHMASEYKLEMCKCEHPDELQWVGGSCENRIGCPDDENRSFFY
jgi:hypothetical protein